MQAQVKNFVNDLPNNLPTLAEDTAYDDYGLEVAVLQRLLVFYGFLHNNDVTGFFGDITNAAVMQFQGSQGLLQDGVVGSDTWAALANITNFANVPATPNAQ
jgi:peptidoglycan hydrolase-like protein with peptidoglycan-binding domain